MRKFIDLIESAQKTSLREGEDEDDFDEFEDEDYDDEEEDEGPEHSTTGYNFGTLAAFYRKVQQVADQHMDSGDEITIEDVGQWVEHHKELFRPGHVTVYRIMRLSDDFVENLQAGDELGQHWSFEPDFDNIEGFDINQRFEAHDGFFMFEATVTTAEVALPLSVAYNCLFPHEKELFLGMNARPKLIGIRRVVDYQVDETPVRPDLNGQEFSV